VELRRVFATGQELSLLVLIVVLSVPPTISTKKNVIHQHLAAPKVVRCLNGVGLIATDVVIQACGGRVVKFFKKPAVEELLVVKMTTVPSLFLFLATIPLLVLLIHVFTRLGENLMLVQPAQILPSYQSCNAVTDSSCTRLRA
jgi:uncharacterized protein involved in response to NO